MRRKRIADDGYDNEATVLGFFARGLINPKILFWPRLPVMSTP